MSHRILIADDDDTLRETLGELLSRLGFGILEAEDGPSALELFRQENPAFTILDFHMPGMTGLEVLETLRREALEEGGPCLPLMEIDHIEPILGQPRTEGLGPRTPFIFLSAEADECEQEAAMAAGAFRFLNKPVSVENLFASVTDLMQVFLPHIAKREGGSFGFSFSFHYESRHHETGDHGDYIEETTSTSFAITPISEDRLPIPFDSILPDLFAGFTLSPDPEEELDGEQRDARIASEEASEEAPEEAPEDTPDDTPEEEPEGS